MVSCLALSLPGCESAPGWGSLKLWGGTKGKQEGAPRWPSGAGRLWSRLNELCGPVGNGVSRRSNALGTARAWGRRLNLFLRLFVTAEHSGVSSLCLPVLSGLCSDLVMSSGCSS